MAAAASGLGDPDATLEGAMQRLVCLSMLSSLPAVFLSRRNRRKIRPTRSFGRCATISSRP